MKLFILFFSFLSIFAHGYTQTPNGTFDDIRDLSSKINIKIPMSDGVKLSTDIWLPITSDSLIYNLEIDGDTVPVEFIRKGAQLLVYPFIVNSNGDTVPNPNPYQLPMIFTRTPYNKQGGSGGDILSVLGYAFALQDMRGRYDSEGAYIPMFPDGWDNTPYINTQHVLDVTSPTSLQNANKHTDGWDSYQYLLNHAKRSFDLDGNGITDTIDTYHNGSIGMFGGSALGNTQYQLASANFINPYEKGLKALLPIVATNEHYNTTGFNNGVFRRMLVVGWVTNQMKHLVDSLISIDNSLFNTIHTPADYNLTSMVDARSLAIDHFCVLKYNHPVSTYYPNSVFRSSMDASFAPVNQYGIGDASGAFSRYKNMNVPAYHLTGWYDIFIDGQINTFNLMRTHVTGTASNLQKLVIGPWAHQTIGKLTTGDATYKNNVIDLIGTSWEDIDNMNFEGILNSELFSWFRDRLNYNGHINVTEPIFRIPEGYWQQLPNGKQVKAPAQNYDVTFVHFINFLMGETSLSGVPIDINSSSGTHTIYMTIPPLDNPPLSGPALSQISQKDFNTVKDVRLYVIGPLDDGIPENIHVGNYWLETDSFPLKNSEIAYKNLYMHQAGTLDTLAPNAYEGLKYYINDPDNTAHGWSIGGNNMIVRTPQDDRNSQGQMNLADPLFASYALNNPSIISFTTEEFMDTMSFIGFPKATLYAKAEALDNAPGLTDCDFFVRLVDVYPDGRELFITEGAVNARAREYARSLYNGQENINAPFSNIILGTIYEYQFDMFPIAYTLGKGHKLKVLVQSKNYTRYQSNAQVPIQEGEFFRREPGDGQTYMYQGVEYHPRTLKFGLAFSPQHPSHISLPIYKGSATSIHHTDKEPIKNIKVVPNPAQDVLNIFIEGTQAEGFYVLYNSMGQEIFNGYINNDVYRLDVRNLRNGLYILKVYLEGNTFTEKVIIR